MRSSLGMACIALSAGLACTAASAAELLDPTPRVAVMSAFAPEWAALIEDTQDTQQHLLHGRRFVTGKLAGKDVVLFLSGISMVNAAMTTQQAIDHFEVTNIVFSGIAGGVDPSLAIGDVVVAEQWGQYLEAVFARDTGEGYAVPPFIAAPFGNHGMIHPKNTEVLRDGLEQPEQRFWFPVDGKLLETAKAVAGNVTLEKCAEADKCMSHQPRVVVGGNGVSGQVFVDNTAFREFTYETFTARVLDMESAATAHVAYVNDVPFIAFRSLSDLAGGGEGENEMGIFFGLASRNSATVVKAFLEALP